MRKFYVTDRDNKDHKVSNKRRRSGNGEKNHSYRTWDGKRKATAIEPIRINTHTYIYIYNTERGRRRYGGVTR